MRTKNVSFLGLVIITIITLTIGLTIADYDDYYDDYEYDRDSGKFSQVPQNKIPPQKRNPARAKILEEQLDGVQMNVSFEIAVPFHSAIRGGKKGGNFKINIHLYSVESFLYCLCSK